MMGTLLRRCMESEAEATISCARRNYPLRRDSGNQSVSIKYGYGKEKSREMRLFHEKRLHEDKESVLF